MRSIIRPSIVLLVALLSGACDKTVATDEPVPPGEVVKADVGVAALPNNSSINPNIGTATINPDIGCSCPTLGVCQACDPDTCQPIQALDGSSCPDDGNSCTKDVCKSGACTHPSTGAACDDGKPCTYGDVCNASGVCTGTAITCTSDTCASRACNGSSACTVTPINLAGQCDDNQACTYGDACTANGTCTGTTVNCTSDACTQRSCNGSANCTSTPIVTCKALDECHDVGVCNAQSGVCTNPVSSTGKSCMGGTGMCVAGTCMLSGVGGAGGGGGSAGSSAGSSGSSTGGVSGNGGSSGSGAASGNAGTSASSGAAGAVSSGGNAGQSGSAGSAGASNGGSTSVAGNGSGAMSSSGDGGEAGAPSSGGQSGSSSGVAGSGVSGSSSGVAGDASNTAGVAPVPEHVFNRDPGGCSCSVPANDSSPRGALLLAGLAVAGALLGRRRTRRAS